MIEKIFQWNPSPELQQTINVALLWLGFSVIVGLTAQLIVPGRKTKGTVSTIVVGLTSCCLSSMVVSWFYPKQTYNPIGIVGFVTSLALAICLLILFHIYMFIFPIRKKEDDAEDNSPNDKKSKE